MKRNFLFFVLTIALTLALAIPALAWEYPPKKYAAFQEYLDFYRSCEDADTQALTAYIDERLTAQPDLTETFDADAYFEQMVGIWSNKPRWIEQNGPGYDESYFRAEMLDRYLTQSYRAWRDAHLAQALAAQYPAEFAAFDADAWFAGYYGGLVSISRETYMETNHLPDEEAFRLDMFAEWANRERGFYGGYCITVNGTPVQFQMWRDLNGEMAVVPRAEHDRLMVPVRAVAETMGLTVDYLPDTRQVVCAGDAGTVVFTLDSVDYSGGTLDVAPYAENGVTYLPVRALGEALGFTVTWYQEFSTAALTA